MKKTKKIVGLLLLCSILFLSSCENPIIYERQPQRFPGSKWKTENGEISFVVEAIHLPLPQLAGTNGYGDDPNVYYFAQGEVNVNGEKIGVYFENFAGSYDVCIISKEIEELAKTTTEYLHPGGGEEAKYVIAWIDCNYKSKKRFDAVVTESKYFNVGEKFVFRRVD
ncbi:MAG: hypothetical protein IKB38_03695 [Clostridia bacterium]|nr:hypothetical protein [Clostridia bacterium]